MGYIDSNKKNTKELTVRLTEKGKKYLAEKNRNLFRVTNFNIGDSDINYNTIQDDLEITDFSGENECADSSKFDIIAYEVFQNGLSKPYSLYNNGLGKIELSGTFFSSFELGVSSSSFTYFTKFKIDETNSGEVILLNYDNRNSLGQGLKIKLFILDDLRIKIEYNNLLIGDKVYSGEVIYSETIKKGVYYNLCFLKIGAIEQSFDLFLNTKKINKNHTYSEQTNVIVPPNKFAHLFSKGKVYGSRTFSVNKILNYYEKKYGDDLTYSFKINKYFDFQFTEGLGNLIKDNVSNDGYNFTNMFWIYK